MKQTNFTICKESIEQNKFSLKKAIMPFVFILTMLFCNFTILANDDFVAMELFLSATQETCDSSSDGSVSVVVAGGVSPYSYEWNTGSPADTTDIVYNLTSGTYTVTVTDALGETAVDSIEVELSPEGLWIMTSTTADADCGPNGIAHVGAMTGVPPYTYQWDDPAMQTEEDAIDLFPGIYHVTVTDSNGCTAIDSTTVGGTVGITECSAYVSSSYNEGVDISIFGGNDGSAAVTVVGGTSPLSYLWSNNQTDPEIFGLNAGTYSVTITDADDCTCVSQITLQNPAKVGDFVWHDQNENGIQDSGEPGIEGVTITLEGTSDAGATVSRTVNSASDGSYIIDGLPAGTYKITFERPSGYVGSPQYIGIDDAIDSDADPITGMTDFFDLALAECQFTIDAGFYQCSSIGDFVWRDANEDGIQDINEPGVEGVYVQLYSAGPDGLLYTDDDAQEDTDFTGSDGHYLFLCVDPGQYYIRFSINTNDYKLTLPYQGNDDELDSNPDTLTWKTEPIFFQGTQSDLSYDAGLIEIICDDFDYGGTIGQNQIICPGDDPEELHTVIPPSGGSGTPEYLWLQSTSGGAFPNPSWIEIPNSNTENYDPPPLFVTTYYIRCIRREGCNSFLTESENYVTITVLAEDDEFCEDENDFFDPDITADIMADDEIMVQWTTNPEDELYYYYVERSKDTVNFEAIGVLRGNANDTSPNDYHYMDTEPQSGRNVYRIKRLELISESVAFSNFVEVFFVSEHQSFLVYPNPVSEILKIEGAQSISQNTNLKLFNATGQVLEIVEIKEGENSVEISMKDYPTGIYFIYYPGDNNSNTKVFPVVKK